MTPEETAVLHDYLIMRANGGGVPSDKFADVVDILVAKALVENDDE